LQASGLAAQISSTRWRQDSTPALSPARDIFYDDAWGLTSRWGGIDG
jgi:hypothetical protein